MLRPDWALIAVGEMDSMSGVRPGPRVFQSLCPAALPRCRHGTGVVAYTGRRAALMKAVGPVRDHLLGAGTRAARSSGHDQGRPLVEAVDEVGQFL